MLIENIIKSISNIPDFEEKEITLKRVEHIKSEFSKLQKKYRKANDDRLTVSHLLSEVNEELEESLSNEKRFIASVSHELRTPLTAILGYGELLDDTSLNNKQKRYLDSMIQSSNHLLSLVSDLLDVAKISDNKIELSTKEIDMDDILNDCATLIHSKIKENVDFIVDIPMFEYKVKADDKRIKQIFINLLSNAAKFTKRGSIRFYLNRLEELPNERLKIVINVDDTGDGIPKEVKDTLFDPFQSTDKTQGTGLGLYISQQIAHMMDGEITVNSKDGIGSSFQVSIIVEKTTKKEIGKTLKNTNIMMFSPKSEFTEKVSKEFMNLNVNFINHDLTHGDTASALIQMVASGRFYDIAVFDMDMFESNTINIAGTLKTINPDIRIIALMGEEIDKDLSIFDGVVNKPISYQRFIKYTEELFNKELFDNSNELDYSQLNILIVEDVELNREYEVEMLNNFFSIECDTAENGLIALEKVKNRRYDAVLMDMRMPVMNGLEATKKIREFDKETPIICMSANVYQEDKEAAKASGMNDFIEKPLDRDDIENKLIKLLKNEFVVDENESREEPKEKIVLEEESIDSKRLKEIALNHLQQNFNEAISMKLFSKAISSIDNYYNLINQNIKTKEIKVLVEDFHALKGVLSNIGLKNLAKRAGEFQKIAEQSDFMKIANDSSSFLQEIKDFIIESKGDNA